MIYATLHDKSYLDQTLLKIKGCPFTNKQFSTDSFLDWEDHQGVLLISFF